MNTLERRKKILVNRKKNRKKNGKYEESGYHPEYADIPEVRLRLRIKNPEVFKED